MEILTVVSFLDFTLLAVLLNVFFCRQKFLFLFPLPLKLRNAQEHTIELETEKEHLQKRVEKYKQRRKEDF